MDLGGGTGHNVDLMERYIGLGLFSKIVVVDLCPSLCAQVSAGRCYERAGAARAVGGNAHALASAQAGRARLCLLLCPTCPSQHPLTPLASTRSARLQARKKVAQHGWTNVEVVEGDACKYALPEGAAAATLVTFSYSLSSERPPALGLGLGPALRTSVRLQATPHPPPHTPHAHPTTAVIPNWHAAVDRAIGLLERPAGILGVCDFYTSSK